MRCGRPAMRGLRARPRPANPRTAESPIAFSSEVDAGSREENASGALVLIQSEPELSSAYLLQAFLESRPVGGIELRGTSHPRHLRGVEHPDHPRRRADDQGVLGKLLALGDDGARADDAAAADPRAVHE